MTITSLIDTSILGGDTGNYTIRKAFLYAGERPVAGAVPLIHLGNAPEITITSEIEYLEHKSSTAGIGVLDKKIPQAITVSVNATLEEMTPEGQLLYFGASHTLVAQALTSYTSVLTAISPGMYFSTEKTGIGIFKLSYDGGTTIFTVGQTVTGAGGATGVVARVVGDATSGILYLKDRNATAYVDDEALTGSGGSAGAAVANGAGAFSTTDMVAFDTSTPTTFYDVTDDFTFDTTTGMGHIVVGGGIAANADVTFVYTAAAGSMDKLNIAQDADRELYLVIQGNSPVGRNIKVVIPKASVAPNGEMSLVGEELATFGLTFSALADTSYATSPYGWVELL